MRGISHKVGPCGKALCAQNQILLRQHCHLAFQQSRPDFGVAVICIAASRTWLEEQTPLTATLGALGAFSSGVFVYS